MNHIRRREISLTVQLMNLKRIFPSGTGDVVRDRLVWLHHIRPHPLAHVYLCRVEYCLHQYPRMFVLDPPLTSLTNGRKVPHVRTREEPIAMCLFFQDTTCWSPDMLLAEVVVPMAYYWLACFEDWLFTGQWHGGATHEITPSPPTISPIFPADLDLAKVA
jgi:hypothetical protein